MVVEEVEAAIAPAPASRVLPVQDATCEQSRLHAWPQQSAADSRESDLVTAVRAGEARCAVALAHGTCTMSTAVVQVLAVIVWAVAAADAGTAALCWCNWSLGSLHQPAADVLRPWC